MNRYGELADSLFTELSVISAAELKTVKFMCVRVVDSFVQSAVIGAVTGVSLERKFTYLCPVPCSMVR